MRILHTSDWHLGRTLHGVDLHEHQAAFVDHLVGLVTDRAVDVVVIAGDVYDRAVPAVPSVRLLGDALRRLTALVPVVLTPGNHDSPVRLGFAADLMRGGLHIRADVGALAEPVLIDDEHGPVAFYGVPYLDPDAVRHTLAPGAAAAAGAGAGAGGDGEGSPPLARSHEAVMGAALDRIRADLASRTDTRSVVVAHAFVSGAAPSDSERDIRVGGVDQVPTTVFDGIDYVALGHLHGAQRVGSSGRLRYSGSPLAFSFGELAHVKSTTIVELAADGGVTTETVPTPVPRRLAEVTGPLDELLGPDHDDVADAWLRVFVTDPVHPDQMYVRVRARFPHVLAVHHTPIGAAAAPRLTPVTAQTDPLEVASDFVVFASGGEATADELAVLAAAYEAARAADETND
ncbi:exonuclease SbcCD subunit D [Frigoribacterium sp. 2-23]|uniref:exonuclease SbcCD subunit D n=1 Tax=Frigoribacterium sp. 2-23 TaxID=3415006 RepID=UPI003C704C03